MKHLIEWRLFESKEYIESICKEYSIENWTLNEDGSIDVEGDVDLCSKKLHKLPIKFKDVSGDFICTFNNLTYLEGIPEWISGDFNCSFNDLTSLQGCPKYVGGDFNCSFNNLTSLEGCPEFVNNNFYCFNNNLTSLKGGPKCVGGDFDCSYNKLTSLEGAPESIRGYFNCDNNPVEQIWNLFEDKDKIEFFNDLDIIRENSIVLDRLIYFLDVIGKPRTKEELRNLIKDYTFI
jgi:hypothetical protein